MLKVAEPIANLGTTLHVRVIIAVSIFVVAARYSELVAAAATIVTANISVHSIGAVSLNTRASVTWCSRKTEREDKQAEN